MSNLLPIVGTITAGLTASVFVASTALAVSNTSDNNHKSSIACIQAGHAWIDGKQCVK